jgi:anaerobic magnesium-protoporphyrin IX monomethyl ester cyclase
MLVTLINPPIIDRKNNMTYSVGIPLGLAYISAYLLEKKIDVQIIDSVGDGLNYRREFVKNFTIIGLPYQKIIERINPSTDLICIAGKFSTQHNVLIQLIKKIKNYFPNIPICIGGNHATYHHKLFLDNGADFVVLGEGEESTYKLCQMILSNKLDQKIQGIASKYNYDNPGISPLIKNINELPFPSRELFPMEAYFKERTSFGPVNYKFAAIMTSRGCPNNCSYCSSAVFWHHSWRARNPKNVVDEIEYLYYTFNIKDFNFIDDNLTLDKKRAIEIFNEIINRKLKINWGAVNGIRPENIDLSLLKLMKKSGCKIITLAPESGSHNVLKNIYNKKISLKKIKEIVNNCQKVKISTSVDFIIGGIGETKKDRIKTRKYLNGIVKAGADEVAIFPLIPYPECSITKERYSKIRRKTWEQLCTGAVPDWYPNFRNVKLYKLSLYISFLLAQIRYHPKKLINRLINLISNKQEVKSDRVLRNYLMSYFSFLKK